MKDQDTWVRVEVTKGLYVSFPNIIVAKEKVKKYYPHLMGQLTQPGAPREAQHLGRIENIMADGHTKIETTETPNVIEQKAAAPCFQVKRLVSSPRTERGSKMFTVGGPSIMGLPDGHWWDVLCNSLEFRKERNDR